MRRRQTNYWMMGVLSLGLLILSGCSTPQAVKSLSTAQTEAMSSFESHLGTYFATIEKLVDIQIEAASEQLDAISDDILALERKKAVAKLKGSTNLTATSTALVDLTKNTKTEVSDTMRLKDELASRKNSLVLAHQRFIASYATLIEAQKRLDAYLQLERADERLLNEALSAVGVSRKDFDEATGKVKGAVVGIADTLGRIRASAS